MAKTPVTVAYGDGVGPEVMRATLQVLEAAGAELAVAVIARLGQEPHSLKPARYAASEFQPRTRASAELPQPVKELRNFDGRPGFSPAPGS